MEGYVPTWIGFSPPQSPVPPKLDPKGYFDIERHTFVFRCVSDRVLGAQVTAYVA